MADKIITIPEPTANSAGIRISIVRQPGNLLVHVEYTSEGVSSGVTLAESDFTAAQLTTLNNLISAVVSKAKPKMGF